MNKRNYEIAIIGGSSAGLAAAQTMGRAGRAAIVFDTARPRNGQSPHAHNFFTRDGVPPLELLAIARKEVQQYPSVSFMQEEITKVHQADGAFSLETASGSRLQARRIILATGVRDMLPEIPGLQEQWGRKVIHCPYCHGWEVKGAPVALIAGGDAAFEMAAIIGHWNRDITILTNGAAIGTATREKLSAMGMPVIETPLAAFHHEGDGLRITFTDGATLSRKAAYLRPQLQFNNALAIQLGCELTENGSVKVDEMQETTVRGVFAAGDLSHPMFHQVSMAAAGGHKAAAMCNNQLIREDLENKTQTAA